jgi:hypothetical protein
MQNGKKKSKPLNIIKGAFNNQSPQSDPDEENSQFEQQNKKPKKTVSGSLNLIAEAFTQENQEEDTQIGEPNRKPAKTVGGFLNLIAEAFTQKDQEEDTQIRPSTRKPAKTVGGSLNLIAEAFTQENQEEEGIQTGPLTRKPVKTVGGSLNLIAEAFTQKDREEDDKDGELQENTKRKVTEPLKMNEQSLVLNSQEEKYRQITSIQDKKVRNDTEPLNPIKESLDS